MKPVPLKIDDEVQIGRLRVVPRGELWGAGLAASLSKSQTGRTTERSRTVRPRVLDKPSPKPLCRLIMDCRFSCAVCFVSACRGGLLQAVAYRYDERLSCLQVHITRFDRYNHHRLHE